MIKKNLNEKSLLILSKVKCLWIIKTYYYNKSCFINPVPHILAPLRLTIFEEKLGNQRGYCLLLKSSELKESESKPTRIIWTRKSKIELMMRKVG